MRLHFLCSVIAGCFISSLQAAETGRGEVEFSGYVIDNAPRWLWQIATPDQTWDVDVADAVTSANGDQVFSLHNKGTLPFLEGYLKEVAVRGGAGMTPLVAFSSGGKPLDVLNGKPDAPQLRVAIPVKNSDTEEEVGKLSFTLAQGMIISRGKTSGSPAGGAAQATADNIPVPLIARLMELLAMNKGIESAGVPLVFNGGKTSSYVLSDSSATQLAASWASQLSDFTLSWPQDKVPARWQATLSAMVTFQ